MKKSLAYSLNYRNDMYSFQKQHRNKNKSLQEKLNTLIFMAQARSGTNNDICINSYDTNLP